MLTIFRAATMAALCLFATVTSAAADGWADSTTYRGNGWAGPSISVRPSRLSAEGAAPRQRASRATVADDDERPLARDREVAEEVGVTVRDLRYYGSQSWPFPHSLMVAYTAQWAGGEIVPQEDEIEAADWFPIDALPGIPPRFSIAGHLIRDTVDRMLATSL